MHSHLASRPTRSSRFSFLQAITILALFGGLASWSQAASPPEKVAYEVNRLLADEIPRKPDAPPAPRCDDATFLRRVFLDLVGQPPTPDDVLAFLLNDDATKRQDVVEQLLKDEDFGRNWASYWRDVIMYRRTEERALIASRALNDYLASELNANHSWDKIAASFITSAGDVQENGDTAIIMAQNGQPEETVAEISRIFLGIQIQCAQCHDHPTDRWKREQFHQLAAFFPRVAVHPAQDSDRRTFVVEANDSLRMPRQMQNNRFRGTPEHYMPNLEDPQARGTVMTPVFFATGQSLEIGTADAERRRKLAEWVSSPDNPWFAKAFANRMWSELCGEGFYEPVDDIGPDRKASGPKTLDYLATEFANSGYDVKWLMRTIVSTDLYQRESRPRRGPEEIPFQANVAQPMRGDQLLNCVLAALGTVEPQPPGGRPGMQYAMLRSTRGAFNSVFGFDPSVRRDEITSTIPQAQTLMNATFLNQAINQNRFALAETLREYPDNDDAILQLYLRTLSRLPTYDETQTCLAHVRQSGQRGDAMEDLLWTLINCTEFAYRK
jgi:hypothetical protein